jgi:hypothetical protein
MGGRRVMTVVLKNQVQLSVTRLVDVHTCSSSSSRGSTTRALPAMYKQQTACHHSVLRLIEVVLTHNNV